MSWFCLNLQDLLGIEEHQSGSSNLHKITVMIVIIVH